MRVKPSSLAISAPDKINSYTNMYFSQCQIIGLRIEHEGKKDGSNYCSSKETSTVNWTPVFVALEPQETTTKGLLTSLFP